jgi:hypothetical protein
MGVEAGIPGEGSSSRRSSLTIHSGPMTMSVDGRGGSKTTPLDKG